MNAKIKPKISDYKILGFMWCLGQILTMYFYLFILGQHYGGYIGPKMSVCNDSKLWPNFIVYAIPSSS